MLNFLTEEKFGRNRAQDAASGHFMRKIFRTAPVVYGCENWPLTVREEPNLRVVNSRRC